MRIINTTSFPDERLREIIAFCCPPGIDDYVMQFNFGRRVGAGAYTRRWLLYLDGRYPEAGRVDIFINLCRRPKLPCHFYIFRFKGSTIVPMTVYSRLELSYI
jgi:hypothetical protein